MWLLRVVHKRDVSHKALRHMPLTPGVCLRGRHRCISVSQRSALSTKQIQARQGYKVRSGPSQKIGPIKLWLSWITGESQLPCHDGSHSKRPCYRWSLQRGGSLPPKASTTKSPAPWMKPYPHPTLSYPWSHPAWPPLSTWPMGIRKQGVHCVDLRQFISKQ